MNSIIKYVYYSRIKKYDCTINKYGLILVNKILNKQIKSKIRTSYTEMVTYFSEEEYIYSNYPEEFLVQILKFLIIKQNERIIYYLPHLNDNKIYLICQNNTDKKLKFKLIIEKDYDDYLKMKSFENKNPPTPSINNVVLNENTNVINKDKNQEKENISLTGPDENNNEIKDVNYDIFFDINVLNEINEIDSENNNAHRKNDFNKNNNFIEKENNEFILWATHLVENILICEKNHKFNKKYKEMDSCHSSRKSIASSINLSNNENPKIKKTNTYISNSSKFRRGSFQIPEGRRNSINIKNIVLGTDEALNNDLKFLYNYHINKSNNFTELTNDENTIKKRRSIIESYYTKNEFIQNDIENNDSFNFMKKKSNCNKHVKKNTDFFITEYKKEKKLNKVKNKYTSMMKNLILNHKKILINSEETKRIDKMIEAKRNLSKKKIVFNSFSNSDIHSQLDTHKIKFPIFVKNFKNNNYYEEKKMKIKNIELVNSRNITNNHRNFSFSYKKQLTNSDSILTNINNFNPKTNNNFYYKKIKLVKMNNNYTDIPFSITNIKLKNNLLKKYINLNTNNKILYKSYCHKKNNNSYHSNINLLTYINPIKQIYKNKFIY